VGCRARLDLGDTPRRAHLVTVSAQTRASSPASLVPVDEARVVIARLERIEALERAGSPADVVLDEVRALLAEAEEWIRAEPGGTERAAAALARCAAAFASRRAIAMA
jgi:hypothetical protein